MMLDPAIHDAPSFGWDRASTASGMSGAAATATGAQAARPRERSSHAASGTSTNSAK